MRLQAYTSLLILFAAFLDGVIAAPFVSGKAGNRGLLTQHGGSMVPFDAIDSNHNFHSVNTRDLAVKRSPELEDVSKRSKAGKVLGTIGNVAKTGLQIAEHIPVIGGFAKVGSTVVNGITGAVNWFKKLFHHKKAPPKVPGTPKPQTVHTVSKPLPKKQPPKRPAPKGKKGKRELDAGILRERGEFEKRDDGLAVVRNRNLKKRLDQEHY
ncbi:hypothetical protein C8Q75DRAFT_125698 [Abortiporus biennis]|nr:hypothetical protein C8Q75DRAFT_125698 [Abortiporus biennis]